MDFCKEFNARTTHIVPGTPIPTLITVAPDRSFTFIIKTPTVSHLLKSTTGLEKGAAKPGHETLATISLKHVYEIAKIKQTDAHMERLSLESIARTVVGSARSLGIKVIP